MADKERVDEILAEFEVTIADLGQLEKNLQGEINDIKITAFRAGRTMSADEIALRNERRTSQTKVRDAMGELAYVTAKRLDDSHEVAALKSDIDEVNLGLLDDLERLQDVERYADAAAKISAGLVKIASSVAKFVV